VVVIVETGPAGGGPTGVESACAAAALASASPVARAASPAAMRLRAIARSRLAVEVIVFSLPAHERDRPRVVMRHGWKLMSKSWAVLLASAEERWEQGKHVENVEEHRRGENGRGADVLGAA
jgi:hypothetical protein